MLKEKEVCGVMFIYLRGERMEEYRTEISIFFLKKSLDKEQGR